MHTNKGIKYMYTGLCVVQRSRCMVRTCTHTCCNKYVHSCIVHIVNCNTNVRIAAYNKYSHTYIYVARDRNSPHTKGVEDKLLK